MKFSRNLIAAGLFFQLAITGCDGKHRGIQEYDCNASGNGCPTGFECELDLDGRALCVDRRGNGPNTPLQTERRADASLSNDDPRQRDSTRDAGVEPIPDQGYVSDGGSSLDMAPGPRPDIGPNPTATNICPDGTHRKIILLGSENRLLEFDPVDFSYRPLGTVDCEEDFPIDAHPTSMAIDSRGVAWIAYLSQPKMTSATQDRHIDGVIVRYDLESGACELVFESLQNMPPAHGLSILPTAQGNGQDDLYAISHPAAEPRSTLYEWSGERGRARPYQADERSRAEVASGDDATLWVLQDLEPAAHLPGQPRPIEFTQVNPTTGEALRRVDSQIGHFQHFAFVYLREGSPLDPVPAFWVFAAPTGDRIIDNFDRHACQFDRDCTDGRLCNPLGFCQKECETDDDCGRYSECFSTDLIENAGTACYDFGYSTLHLVDATTGALRWPLIEDDFGAQGLGLDRVRQVPMHVVGADLTPCPAN